MDVDVPSSLKRLVRTVMRGFYSIEHVLLMDMLIRKPCMKEEDLEHLLKFERKQLRTIIAQLKNDKMIKQRLRMETGPDGKATRQNYHYINYRAFVNVVKYKLDHMRRKIETEERDNTSRASFICTDCKKTYTDLEGDQLSDMSTREFRCRFSSSTKILLRSPKLTLALSSLFPPVFANQTSRKSHWQEKYEPWWTMDWAILVSQDGGSSQANREVKEKTQEIPLTINYK